jgi:Spy/CpxP family protein refolding chaperone
LGDEHTIKFCPGSSKVKLRPGASYRKFLARDRQTTDFFSLSWRWATRGPLKKVQPPGNRVVASGKFKKILLMKRVILLPLAGIIGVAALVISQLAAADPNPTSSPQASPTAEDPPPPADAQKFCRRDQFGGARDRFHGPGRHWARHRDHVAEEQMLDRLLNLTEEQEEKVKEIMAASRPKIKAIREEQRVKIQGVMDDAREQIRPILSPAQQKVFDDARQRRENARKLKEEARKLRRDKEGGQSE